MREVKRRIVCPVCREGVELDLLIEAGEHDALFDGMPCTGCHAIYLSRQVDRPLEVSLADRQPRKGELQAINALGWSMAVKDVLAAVLIWQTGHNIIAGAFVFMGLMNVVSVSLMTWHAGRASR